MLSATILIGDIEGNKTDRFEKFSRNEKSEYEMSWTQHK